MYLDIHRDNRYIYWRRCTGVAGVNAFFEVGHSYLLAGDVYTVHAVQETIWGPLAWATFPRGKGLDVQTLCQVQFDESEEVT